MQKNDKLPANGIREYRAYASPDLNADPAGNIVEGHAAVFGQSYDIGGMWEEVVERGAFDRTDFSDVVLTINHDLRKIPLARSRGNKASSTLKVSVDDIGLATRGELDIQRNKEADALYGSVERGDMSGMSFIFVVRDCKWERLETDYPLRRITDVAVVFETSVVSFPASPGTDINARDASALESAKKVLESARAAELESSNEQRNTEESNSADALEFERLKAQLLINMRR